MGGSLSLFAFPAPLSSNPPIPIAAAYQSGAEILEVTFDQAIIGVAAQPPGNFRLRIIGKQRVGISIAQPSSTVLRFGMAAFPVPLPNNVVNFVAGVNTISNAVLQPVAPFSGFPLTVLP